jgi:hypothetical protein
VNKRFTVLTLIGLATFYIAIGSVPLRAEADLSVKVEVDRAFATIGDEINFRVTAIHEPGVTLLDINPQNALADFEIKKVTDFSTKEKGQILEGKNFVITNYELGEYVIRSFPVRYRVQSGDVKEIKTNSLYVTIESVDKNKKPGSDIRGIKGVQKIKPTLWPWFLGFGVLLVGTSIYFFLKRSKQKWLESESQVLLSPHDEACQALSRLQHSDLIRKGQIKMYFFQMSEILRHYFERRYPIRALELTTYELRIEFKDKISSEHLQLIDEVLSFCDLVKFAKYIPTPLEIIRQNNQAKQIIDLTKEEVLQTTDPETVQNKS